MVFHTCLSLLFDGKKDMTDLKKIIDKAVSGGLDLETWFNKYDGVVWIIENINEKRGNELADALIKEMLIFSIPFLKAFFGEEDMWYKTECTCGGIDFHIGGHDAHKPDCAKPKADRGWKHNAQQLVLSDDRIKYLMNYMEV